MDIREESRKIYEKSVLLSEAMGVCTTLLKHSDEANFSKEYLKNRIPELAYKDFTFGYYPPNSQKHLLLQYINEQTLLDAGLIYKKKVYYDISPREESFALLDKHNLVMPFKNLNGDIISIVGRSLLSKEDQDRQGISKYKNTNFQKSLNLFGLYQAKKNILDKNFVVIVEGQFDCITCHRLGIDNCVALGGVSFSKYQLYLLLRYTNNLVLALDNDNPGRQATQKIIDRFGKNANIHEITIPECYKDIDEWLEKAGSEDFIKLCGANGQNRQVKKS